MRTKALPFFLLAVLAAPGRGLAQHEHAVGDVTQLGKVKFEISCQAPAPAEFERGMTLLHSFWYAEAEKTFAKVAEKNPRCAMAYWGIAMSLYHPLWEAPGKMTLQRGWDAVQKAQAAPTATERERAYVAAIEMFYKDHETRNHLARTMAYEQAMQQLAKRYPEDHEAQIFCALALLGTATASPPDKTYSRQKQAGAILEKVFPANADHPGVAHYIIHSYDFPPLAERGVEAARRYAKIAPDSPHAQHMPSHIFTRLGLWDDSIASNLASAAAARKHGEVGDELHALDYLVYAYLQQARDKEALEIAENLPAVKTGEPSSFAGFYARAAIPARYVIETRAWQDAAKLEIPAGVFPGGRYAWTEANFHFARALGAAHTGQLDVVRQAISSLQTQRETLLQSNEPGWAEQVEIQRLTASAWLARAEGKNEEARKLMREAANRDDAMDKHPVTPGAITPARELLGEMLLELKQPQDALAAFEAVLAAAPNRFHALYGAGRAAQMAGDQRTARDYFAKLVEITRKADTERAELREARAFLSASAFR